MQKSDKGMMSTGNWTTMTNRSLAITLLTTVALTLMLTAASGISSIQQAKAQTTGQKGKNEATSIGDKDLLQVDATIIAGILILLTISSIKN